MGAGFNEFGVAAGTSGASHILDNTTKRVNLRRMGLIMIVGCPLYKLTGSRLVWQKWAGLAQP